MSYQGFTQRPDGVPADEWSRALQMARDGRRAARKAADAKATYEHRKVNGLCTKCGALLPVEDDWTSLLCQKHREIVSLIQVEYIKRRNRSPSMRKRRREQSQAWRKADAARRSAKGQCYYCDEDAKPGTTRCPYHSEQRRKAQRLRRRRRATNGQGGKAELLEIVQAIVIGARRPLSSGEILAEVEADMGSIGDTAVAAERRLYRSISTLLKWGCLERVGGAKGGARSKYVPGRKLPERDGMARTVVDEDSDWITERESRAINVGAARIRSVPVVGDYMASMPR